MTSLTITSLEPRPCDDIPVVRGAYRPFFNSNAASGCAVVDFENDRYRLSYDFFGFVPPSLQPFLARMESEAVAPNPEGPGRVVFLNWADWRQWRTLALYVREARNVHHAFLVSRERHGELEARLRERFPELVAESEAALRAKRLSRETDQAGAFGLD
jgi:hypothetical protein